jgi:hypothetical protein
MGQDSKIQSGLPQRPNRPPITTTQKPQSDQPKIIKSPANGLSNGQNDFPARSQDPRQRPYFDNPSTRDVRNTQPLVTSSTNPTSFKLPFNVEEIRSELNSQSDKSFPSPFPSKSTYPEYFPSELKQIPISQSAIKTLLETGSKNNLTKEEQIQKFINYKKEVEFYKKYIQMNEAKKQKMHEELAEIKNSSFNHAAQLGTDGQLNQDQNYMAHQDHIYNMGMNEHNNFNNEFRMDDQNYGQLYGGQQNQPHMAFGQPVNSPLQFGQPKTQIVNQSLNGSFTSQARGNNMVFHNAIPPANPGMMSNPPLANYTPYNNPQSNRDLPNFSYGQMSNFGHANEPYNDYMLGGQDPPYNPLMKDLSQNQSFLSSHQNRAISPINVQQAPPPQHFNPPVNSQSPPPPQYSSQPASRQPQMPRSNNPFMTQIK